jgi:hypothetical protein
MQKGTFNAYWIKIETDIASCFQGRTVEFNPKALVLDRSKNEKYNLSSKATESEYEAIKRAPQPSFEDVNDKFKTFSGAKFQVFFRPYSDSYDEWIFGYIDNITHKKVGSSFMNVHSWDLETQTTTDVSTLR